MTSYTYIYSITKSMLLLSYIRLLTITLLLNEKHKAIVTHYVVTTRKSVTVNTQMVSHLYQIFDDRKYRGMLR